jgi:hypothetical protein
MEKKNQRLALRGLILEVYVVLRLKEMLVSSDISLSKLFYSIHEFERELSIWFR